MSISLCQKSRQLFGCLHYVYSNKAIHQRLFSTKIENKAETLLRRKLRPTDRALAHFDDFYYKVYRREWPSIRLALLGEKKFCAIINNYDDYDAAIGKLTDMGCINVREEYLRQLEEFKTQEEIGSPGRLPSKQQKKFEERITAVQEETKTSDQDAFYKKNTEDSLYTPVLPAFDETLMDPTRVILPSKDGNLFVNDSALNIYVPATELVNREEYVLDAEEYQYYQSEEHSGLKVTVEPETELNFPRALGMFVFESGNISEFPHPRYGAGGNLDYYLMNAASVMPILALNLQLDDDVLDLCSAPGGKLYCMLQSLLPGSIVANDSSLSRLNKIKKVCKQYFTETNVVNDVITFLQKDGIYFHAPDEFNKVLVDVPCLNDRHALMVHENNIFHPNRVVERTTMPEIQTALLYAALRSVKRGGTVVYSTCTLSPIQNDGVVYMALKKIWEETKMDFVVKDMTKAFAPLRFVCRFGNPENLGLRYGQLVLPYLPNNYGPMYFSKLVRIK